MIVVDNGYAAATGGQDAFFAAECAALAQESDPEGAARRRRPWVHTVYDLRCGEDARSPERGAHDGDKGPKVIIASVGMHAEQAAARAPADAQSAWKRASASCANVSA